MAASAEDLAMFAPEPAGQAQQGASPDDLAMFAPAAAPSAWDRVKGSFSRLGSTIAEGASTLGRTAVNEVASLPGSIADTARGLLDRGPGALLEPRTDYLTTHPEVRREIERGVGDTVTFGLGNKAAAAVDPENFGPRAEAMDANAAPGARAAGAVGGMLLPSPATVAAGGVARAIPGAGALPGAARGLAAYEATAPAAAAIQAPEGHRMDAALDAATDPAGLLLAGGAGAASGVAPTARALLQRKGEERMVDQAVKDLAGNKETGMSKPTDRRMIARQAAPLKEELRTPEGLKIADTARKDPAAAWDMVKKRVDDITESRAASYAAVDTATEGGVRVKEFRRFLEEKAADLGREPGQQLERQAVEGMIKDVDGTWGNQLSPSVPSLKFRQYVTRLQRNAADTMGQIEETRRMQILEQVSGLAKDFLDRNLDLAKKLDPEMGPVVDGLRDNNKRVAAWLSVEDALKTRASKLETNNMVDNRPKMLAAGAAAATAAMHYLHAPAAAAGAAAVGAAPYVIPPIDRAVTRAAARTTPSVSTASPAAVSRLMLAARNGATRAQLQQQAEQDGTPPELAANIAQQYGR